MAILDVLHYPDARLRKKAEPVEQVDEEVRTFVDDMFETMYDAPGIGLAATQVNVHKQIIVIDISKECDEPLCLINPEIIKKDGTKIWEEGCLSVPEYFADVTRAETITVKALNQQGEVFEKDADGLLSICIQHEIDHLRGKLFVDYLSPLKQQRVRKKMIKMFKQAGGNA